MEKWKKNLYVVFFAEMIAITGMAFVVPFLPFYVKELGITDANLVAQWSGWLMGAPALVMVIISPFWGFLADRVGRKPMVERALFGSSIVIFLMAWAGNIYQLLFLRLLQGLLTGTIAACTALISTSSPSKKMGFSLGLLQTGVFLGIFLGPLLGGISADIFGFRNSFRITSALLFISGWLIFFLVEEKFTPSNTKKNIIPFKKMMALIFNHKQLLVMFIILFLVQFSIKTISPILALFVETIVSDPKNISTLTGLMFALTGLTAAFSAINIGKLIEKKPGISTPLLMVSLIGTGFFFLPQGFVTNIMQLALLRLCLGLFYGAIIPITNTIISLSTPSQHRGKAFGLANSNTFLGAFLGPITGGFLMATFNISVVFVFTASILLLAGSVLPIVLKKIENS
jgi:DHA1 family multidrug resistance protein-like MFS transporter